MKKIKGIFAALFLITSISFANSTDHNDCMYYAFEAAAAEESFYGETYDFMTIGLLA
jgi:hypothetical protein